MVALAFGVGTWLAARRAPACGLAPELIYDSAVPVLLSALAGAKLTYFATVGAGPVNSLTDLIGLLRGGFVYLGGVAGGAIGAVWWLTRRGASPFAFADAIAPAMGVSLAVGRLGCFLNGCCYGRPVAWGIAVPSLGDGVPRHPVPLYEAATVLVLGATLWFVPPRADRPGRSFGYFLIAYAAIRFGMEMLRDDPRGSFGALSPSQGFSVLGLAIGVWMAARRPRP